MPPDLVCDASVIGHHNLKDSPATNSMDNRTQSLVNHYDDTSSKLGDPSPSDSNSTNCIKFPRPDQDDSMDEDGVGGIPPHLGWFDLKYPTDGSGYAAPVNGYQEWNVGLKHLIKKPYHEIKKGREAKRTGCLAQGLPAESLEPSLSADEFGSSPWVFEDEAATSFINCTKGDRQTSSKYDLGNAEDDVEDLPIRCDILHLRYPADESGYAAPARGYEEWQDRSKEKRNRSRRIGKAQDAGMRQQRLDQGLLAEGSEYMQHRKYAGARWRAEKQIIGEDASDTDTPLSDDEFGPASWVFEEPSGPRLSGDGLVKNYSRTPPNSVRESIGASKYNSPENQEIQQTVVRPRQSKYRVFSKPDPRKFIPLSEFDWLTREERRAKGVLTPPRSPSPLHSLFGGHVDDGPSVTGLQETDTESIPVNEHEADTEESSPMKTHDSSDTVISSDLQPTVEPDEDEPIFASQHGQVTEDANEKEAVTASQGTENQDENREASQTEILAANTISYSRRTSAEMPKCTSGELGLPRYRKRSIDVWEDAELLMYSKLHGTDIPMEPMNPDDPDVIHMSEFDFMEREERMRMGIPTPPSRALSPSENTSTETASGGFYERVKKRRYPCVGQKWNTRRPHFTSPKPDSIKRHWGTFGRYYSSEEETETEVPRSDTKHRTRKEYREHRRGVPVQDTSEDVNIIIDLYLNIDPELQAKVSYGKQKTGDCVLEDFKGSPVDVPEPEPEPQRGWFNVDLERVAIMTGLVGLVVGVATGMVFRRFK
ncbi:hypothetical protein H101_01829 [Trichophyton interdigitale H6]|nr:hypothetical protein H101_01829 [Trichophyton interdigitale H6]